MPYFAVITAYTVHHLANDFLASMPLVAACIFAAAVICFNSSGDVVPVAAWAWSRRCAAAGPGRAGD